jgi:hypothetical protein
MNKILDKGDLKSSFILERNYFIKKLQSPIFLLKTMPWFYKLGLKWFLLKSNGKIKFKDRLNYKPIQGLPDRESLLVSHFDTDCKVSFPVYSIKNPDLSELYDSDFIDHDPHDLESRYAANRFHKCRCALLQSDESVEAALLDARRWFENKPDNSSDAWETYSVCERTCNLILLLAVRGDKASVFNPSFLRDQLTQSALWIFDNLESYDDSRVNNHILNNARALILVGSMYGFEALVDSGLIIFDSYLTKLLGDEGSLREGSMHYQVVITNWLADAYIFASNAWSGAKKSEQLAGLERMLNKAAFLCAQYFESVKDFPFVIGDVSPDASPKFSRLRFEFLYRKYLESENRSLKESNFTIGDWTILSNNAYSVILRVPKNSYPPKWPIHGHSDLCHFVFSWNKLPIIVDPGRSRYTKNWLNLHQISSSSHNAPLVNGCGPLADSLLTGGYWCPKPYSSIEFSLHKLSSSSISISHSGYSRNGPVESHNRTIIFDNNSIIVRDSFKGYGVVFVSIAWHLSPEFMPSSTDIHNYESTQSRFCVNSTIFDKDGDSVTLNSSREKYIYSPHYGAEIEASCSRFSIEDQLPFTIETVMSISKCAA